MRSNVGIHYIEYYVPPYYIEQSELETFDGVSSGKYSIGLGQEQMSFCSDREDSISMSLTVVDSLLKKSGISYADIGRIDVGTESIMDRSKSIKSYLMDLFTECGNLDVEGCDTYNACYGGTNALFNACSWVESSSWDERWALVVSTDIATYATGPARPSGGAGAVALLIGPNAPIVLDPLRASYSKHVYDFYKPDMTSEYPQVQGKLSLECYLAAIDGCYEGLARKHRNKGGRFSLENCDFVCFHTPFNKMIQKATARLRFNELINTPADERPELADVIIEALNNPSQTLSDKPLEKALVALMKQEGIYAGKVAPGDRLNKRVGNMYTASIFGSLISLLSEISRDGDQSVLMFSYGSGLCATMFTLKLDHTHCGLQTLIDEIDIGALDERVKCTPQQFVDTLQIAESRFNTRDYTPTGEINDLTTGCFYLCEVTDSYQRIYTKKE
ncbi:hypothetical protein PCE1_001420 [Barthelona sp. PCE]